MNIDSLFKVQGSKFKVQHGPRYQHSTLNFGSSLPIRPTRISRSAMRSSMSSTPTDSRISPSSRLQQPDYLNHYFFLGSGGSRRAPTVRSTTSGVSMVF